MTILFGPRMVSTGIEREFKLAETVLPLACVKEDVKMNFRTSDNMQGSFERPSREAIEFDRRQQNQQIKDLRVLIGRITQEYPHNQRTTERVLFGAA